MSGLQCAFLLGCAMGHTAAFAVNAALVTTKWQHHTWTDPLHPLINTEHKIIQDTNIVFESLVWPGRELNQVYQLCWCVLKQLGYLANENNANYVNSTEAKHTCKNVEKNKTSLKLTEYQNISEEQIFYD